jgi:hypothetical protein
MKAQLASTSKDRKPPKVLEHVRVYPGEEGGHIIEHHFSSYEHPPERYPFGQNEGNEAVAHLAEHMKITHDMKSEPEAETETAGSSKEQNV